jgi:RNA polymerase sigma factor (sigma-70 family)
MAFDFPLSDEARSARCALDVADDQTPESLAAEAETSGLIDIASSGLSMRDRALLRMKFDGEMTTAEIAAQLGISGAAVSKATARAIARIRVSLQLMGVERYADCAFR